MTHSNNVITIERALVARMLTGFAIALLIILFFVLQVDNPSPEWHKTWWVRPVVITPLAGAAGGLFFHLLNSFAPTGSWKKIALSIIGVIGFLIATWMGFVLGLAGTLWN